MRALSLPAASPFLASASYSSDAPSPLHLYPSVEKDGEFCFWRLLFKCKVGEGRYGQPMAVLLGSLLQEQKKRNYRDIPKGHMLSSLL